MAIMTPPILARPESSSNRSRTIAKVVAVLAASLPAVGCGKPARPLPPMAEVSGTVTLKARFNNEDNTLWPGQFVPVTLKLYVEPNAIMVPTPAVLYLSLPGFFFA